MSKRPRKPTALKLLEGNRGKRPLPKAEPKPKPIAPKPPRDIDKAAKKTWRRLAPILERVGLLTEADGDAFANLCQIRSRLIEIRKELNGQLVIRHNILDPRGVVVEVVEMNKDFTTLERQYYALFRQYAGEFGLSPRGRVGLTIGNEPDDDDDLLT